MGSVFFKTVCLKIILFFVENSRLDRILLQNFGNIAPLSLGFSISVGKFKAILIAPYVTRFSL